MANAQRKTWIHGFFQNTFNAETGNWQLRDSRNEALIAEGPKACLLYTSPSPRDGLLSRMPSSA